MGISQIFDNFYVAHASGAADAGCVYWVPVAEIREVPYILQVVRSTPEEHEITDFLITEPTKNHFRGGGRLPIKRLNLADNEELLLAKAKMRPCVVLGKAHIDEKDLKAITDGEQRRQADYLCRPLYLLAPMYSCATYSKRTAWGPIMTARVKALWYPHLCYLKELEGNGLGSILRLDHVFASALSRPCNPECRQLHPEVFEIVLSQMLHLLGGVPSDALVVVKELVKDCLPDELQQQIG